jgi:hypothetical protein
MNERLDQVRVMRFVLLMPALIVCPFGTAMQALGIRNGLQDLAWNAYLDGVLRVIVWS